MFVCVRFSIAITKAINKLMKLLCLNKALKSLKGEGAFLYPLFFKLPTAFKNCNAFLLIPSRTLSKLLVKAYLFTTILLRFLDSIQSFCNLDTLSLGMK